MPQKKKNLSATSVSTQVNFGVDLLTFRPYIVYKRRKAKNYKIVPVMFSYPVLHNNSVGGNGCQHFRTVFFIAEPFSGGKQILQKVVLCLGYSQLTRVTDGRRTDRRENDLNSG